MQELNKSEYKMIRSYKTSKNNDVALYFFNKFKEDLVDLIFYKINRKFSSVPFEKGDLFYFIWNGLKTTLNNYKKGDDFNGLLIKNCYFTTLNEIRKFVTNGELIMNLSFSLDSYETKIKNTIDRNRVDFNQNTREDVLKNLIDDACVYVKNYTKETIKKVIYLKSLGYSKKEIAKQLKINVYYVTDLLNSVEKMVEKFWNI